MDRESPGGDASRPGDLPSNLDESTAAQPGEGASSPPQPPADPGTVHSNQRHRFTVQSGSKSFTGAAERHLQSAKREPIEAPGSLPATADPQPRHGIEVVHVAGHHVAEHGEAPRKNPYDQPSPEDDVAARMMQGIEEAVAELRRHAAGRLISLHRPTEIPPEEQPAQTDPCGVVSKLLSRIRERARRLAAEKPLPTAAALIGLGIAFGAALRGRKSHH